MNPVNGEDAEKLHARMEAAGATWLRHESQNVLRIRRSERGGIEIAFYERGSDTPGMHGWLSPAALADSGFGAASAAPVPMRLTCPACNTLHVDVGEFATKPHHTHACQACGAVWRPAIVPTVGVRFLPGFKNEDRTP